MALVLEKAHGTVQLLRVDAHGVETLDASTQLRSILSNGYHLACASLTVRDAPHRPQALSRGAYG